MNAKTKISIDIIEKESEVSNYMSKNGLRNWELNNSCSRETMRKWRQCATNLANALKRTEYYKCESLDHSDSKKRFYHENDESCPIIKICEDAIDEFDKLNLEKPTIYHGIKNI